MKAFVALFSLFFTSCYFLPADQPTIDNRDREPAFNIIIMGRDIEVWSNILSEKTVPSTSEDVTFFVKTNGNDKNDCLSESTACATIQEAVDRIPMYIRHAIEINVGRGSFVGAVVESRFISMSGSLLIKGELGTPTLITGSVSGTSTGGSTVQLVDSGQNWTINDLRGHYLLVEGEYRSIRDNTGTTINLSAPFSETTSGKIYSIVEPTTVINSPPSEYEGWVGYGMFEVYGIHALRPTSLSFKNFHIDCLSSAYDAFDIVRNQVVTVERVRIVDPYWGLYIAARGEVYLYDVIVTGAYQYGIFCENTLLEQSRLYIRSSGTYGLLVSVCDEVVVNGTFENSGYDGVAAYHVHKLNSDWIRSTGNDRSGVILGNVQFGDFDTTVLSSNNRYGIELDSNLEGNRIGYSFANMVGDSTIANNTLGGIIALNHSTVAVTDCSGSGNGGYGIRLETSSGCTITGDTSITGASGDATIDEGTTALTWSIDFANDGDKVSNSENLTLIERKD